MKHFLLQLENNRILRYTLDLFIFLVCIPLNNNIIRSAFALSANLTRSTKLRILFFFYKFKLHGKIDFIDPNFRLVEKKKPLTAFDLNLLNIIIDHLQAVQSLTLYQQICLQDLKYLANKADKLCFHDIFIDNIEPLKQQLPNCYERKKPTTHERNPTRFSKTAAKIALENTYDYLAHHGIKSFLVSGTFLGAVREKDFLAHDYDIDLGVFETDTNIDELIGIFAKHKDFILESYDTPYLVKLKYKNIVPIDIFIHFQDGKICWHGSSYHRWENERFDLHAINFLNKEYLAPVDYDKYLTENYDDWRTPKIDFDCFYDTPNVKQQHTHEGTIFLLKQCLYSYSKGDYDRFISFAERLNAILKQKNR